MPTAGGSAAAHWWVTRCGDTKTGLQPQCAGGADLLQVAVGLNFDRLSSEDEEAKFCSAMCLLVPQLAKVFSWISAAL